MKVEPAYSHAPEATIELAKSMAAFCRDLQQFGDIAPLYLAPAFHLQRRHALEISDGGQERW